jgi:hypothetical protein
MGNASLARTLHLAHPACPVNIWGNPYVCRAHAVASAAIVPSQHVSSICRAASRDRTPTAWPCDSCQSLKILMLYRHHVIALPCTMKLSSKLGTSTKAVQQKKLSQIVEPTCKSHVQCLSVQCLSVAQGMTSMCSLCSILSPAVQTRQL